MIHIMSELAQKRPQSAAAFFWWPTAIILIGLMFAAIAFGGEHRTNPARRWLSIAAFACGIGAAYAVSLAIWFQVNR